MFNSFATLFIVRTVELLEIFINRRLHLFILGKSLTIEPFSQVWKEKIIRGAKSAEKNAWWSNLNCNSLIVTIAITDVWTGALSWWNNTFFSPNAAIFFLFHHSNAVITISSHNTHRWLFFHFEDNQWKLSYVRCFDYSFVSGLKWWTYVSSIPVKKLPNLFPSSDPEQQNRWWYFLYPHYRSS